MPKHPNAGTVEFYRERHAVETPLTLEVLRALPADKLAYKPHEQSSSAEAIFWTIVRCLITRNEVAAVGEADLTAEPPPSYRTMLAASELRGKNHVVRRVLFLVGVDHFVLLAVVNIDTFQVKPALLFGRKRGYQQDLVVVRSIKCIAKQWIDPRSQKRRINWTRALSGCSLRRHSSEIRTGCANQRPSGSVRGLCQEDEKSSCCTKDGGGPSGAAL
jgi:hypothetical protein